MLFGESPGSQVGKAATHPLHLPLFPDASNYAREGLGSKMLGARGSKRQCDIGKFDVAPETVQRALSFLGIGILFRILIFIALVAEDSD
jgi:hypothetical protein